MVQSHRAGELARRPPRPHNGRNELNFSEWDEGQDADDLAEVVGDREMPLAEYTWLHPDARLSAPERRQLIDALRELERSHAEANDSDRRGSGPGNG